MDIGLIRAQLDNGGRVITDEEAHTCLKEAERLILLVLDYTPRRGPDKEDEYHRRLDAALSTAWEAKAYVALRLHKET